MAALDTSPVLVMTQLTSVTRCDFDILDTTGAVAGAVTTKGSALARFFTGPRQLSVVDSDGSPFVLVDDVVNLGRDRYELYDGAGTWIGRVTKEFTLVRKRLTVETVGGDTFALAERDLWDRDFELSGPAGRLLTVQRTWPGVVEGLLGRSRYVVAFEPTEQPLLRRAALGALLALELVRLKERSNSGGAAVG